MIRSGDPMTHFGDPVRCIRIGDPVRFTGVGAIDGFERETVALVMGGIVVGDSDPRVLDLVVFHPTTGASSRRNGVCRDATGSPGTWRPRE